MKYYVIINGNSSLDIQGLAIESLPNISKPLIRTTREEIDGRDGDIITKLGYSAYDKTLNIGLWGNYDINEVIAFFNEEGVITFSNEPDKYYKFHILNRIDFVNQLEKFKKASITIHCQPFKYKEQEAKIIEEEEHTTSGTSFNLSDTLEAPLEIDLKGNTSQIGTPTPSSPIPVNVVSGDNEIEVCGKNLFDKDNANILDNTYINPSSGKINNANGTKTLYIPCKPNTTYTIQKTLSARFVVCTTNSIPAYLSQVIDIQEGATANNLTITTSANANYLCVFYYFSTYDTTITEQQIRDSIQIELGNQPSTYEAYNGTTYNIDLPVENLFDKDNANIGSFYIYNNKILTSVSDKIIILGIKPNTTYTIQKGLNATTSNNRFKVGTCVDTPANNVSLTNYVGYSDGTQVQEITITSGVNDKYLVVQVANNQTNYDEIKGTIQVEYGTKANTYTPYGTTPIELNKIGTYQDYIYKENNKWYLHKEIGKVVLDGSEDGWYNIQYGTNSKAYHHTNILRNNNLITIISNIAQGVAFVDRVSTANVVYRDDVVGSEIVFRNTPYSSIDDWKTFLSTTNAICYYILAKPTNTEITYTPLIEQLNTLEQAQSYEGTTNINQVNNDLPFIIDLTYYTGDTSITITNDGNIYSKPLLELKGTGNINIYLNGIQVFVVSLNNEIIYIDTDKMEAYYQGTLKNRQVVGDYNNFKLQSGNNTIQVDGGYVEYLKITNYSRWV